MIKDLNFLKKFKYLSHDSYKTAWATNNYGTYSKTHKKKIKNYWDTFEHYQFNKNLLNK